MTEPRWPVESVDGRERHWEQRSCCLGDLPGLVDGVLEVAGAAAAAAEPALVVAAVAELDSVGCSSVPCSAEPILGFVDSSSSFPYQQK